MNSLENARYRLRIAGGFLVEARQDVELERWRSAVGNGVHGFDAAKQREIS